MSCLIEEPLQAMPGWGRAAGVWRPRTGAEGVTEGVTERAFCCHHPLRFPVEIIMRHFLWRANQTKISSWHQTYYDQFWTVHTAASLIPETPSVCHFSLPHNCSDEWLLQTVLWPGFCGLTVHQLHHNEVSRWRQGLCNGLFPRFNSERMRVCMFRLALEIILQ